jgi:Ni/Co efflux regulator RcnB
MRIPARRPLAEVRGLRDDAGSGQEETTMNDTWRKGAMAALAVGLLTAGSLAGTGAWAKPHDDGPPGQAKKGRDDGPPGLEDKGGVPPGLAKKGGLPPGQAKKLYRRGETMPRTYWAPTYYVARPAEYRLPPPPPGSRWMIVNGDAYLVRTETGLIMDVVQSLLR